MGSSHGQQTIQGACVSETAVHDHGRRLNQREFGPMAEVPFRPARQLRECKGKGASASREFSSLFFFAKTTLCFRSACSFQWYLLPEIAISQGISVGSLAKRLGICKKYRRRNLCKVNVNHFSSSSRMKVTNWMRQPLAEVTWERVRLALVHWN